MGKDKDSYMHVFTQPSKDWIAHTFSAPTAVQQEAWPAIAEGGSVLISAPTGTGKTLSAFLVFVDKLQALANQGKLKEQLYLIYVSPLKSLAQDIRENLNKPLAGIAQEPNGQGAAEITVGIRTGDTPQRDRQRMIKHPPHILIITPESLYLMLTSTGGQTILHTAEALIIDELHALIDTKRGAHLMLSVARLEKLCKRKLQRIGLSATIEPLQTAADYLSLDAVSIIAPHMQKQIHIEVNGLTPALGRRKDPVWEELAENVYAKCLECRSVIAFSEGRRYAEKLAYYVNQLGGEDFARVHHGSMSKEQRLEVEAALRNGTLRLLCATSSMELGIDVGSIDQVLQIGCPRSISSTMQRLGRAGHNPGRISYMFMYPRTSQETLFCGMSAAVAKAGGIEQASPPKKCLDVLAQQLVSMAAVSSGTHRELERKWYLSKIAYTIDDVMELLQSTYTFCDVSKQEVINILCMLAGDYEHKREVPVRPRILYDRVHGCVLADSYSRMLAVAAGGTIPDKGMYIAKTEDGVKVGELDEEFVYETRLGDRFMLGANAWQVVGMDKDSVVVTQTYSQGARLPFWKGEIKGRSLKTSLAFGAIMRKLSEAYHQTTLPQELQALGLDAAAVEHTSEFLKRQIKATEILPDDQTILIEHFKDSTGSPQAMLHTMFGRRVNAPLALLLQDAAQRMNGTHIGCVDEEDGILLYSYGEGKIEEGLLYTIDPEAVQKILEIMLPLTPVFSMNFRYNAARALMMGMRRNKRQPLWMQRLRSTEMLEALLQEEQHPLILETKRECMEDQWDLKGLLKVLYAIRSGDIHVHEMQLDTPSPLSLPLQWRVEAAEMYEYTPTTPRIHQAVYEELQQLEQIKPSLEALQHTGKRKKTIQNANALHTLLMMEGDMTAQEIKEVCAEGMDAKPAEHRIADWLHDLTAQGLITYIEPGLWIAAEQREEYAQALAEHDANAGMHIIRRMLYYRQTQTLKQIQERYLPQEETVQSWLQQLCRKKEAVEDDGCYYHFKQYERARKQTIQNLRTQAATQPSHRYAALLVNRVLHNAPAKEQLKDTLALFCNQRFTASLWESVLLPARINGYQPELLDQELAQGEFFWKLHPDGTLSFHRYEDIDWEQPVAAASDSCEDLQTEEMQEQRIYQRLCLQGASFLHALNRIPQAGDVHANLLKLAERGLVCADSFTPVRQWLNQKKLKKASTKQQLHARAYAMSSGRWDIIRPRKPITAEALIQACFQEYGIVCRETFRIVQQQMEQEPGFSWREALDLLSIWEFTGRVRRGYFVKGLSGTQFIWKQEYEGSMHMLAHPKQQICWLNAQDPMQPWGKLLEHTASAAFMNIAGTAVALAGGLVVMVFERQGSTLKIFDINLAEEALCAFVQAYRKQHIYPDKKRLLVKEYPKESEALLKKAGFYKDMLDYMLYR